MMAIWGYLVKDKKNLSVNSHLITAYKLMGSHAIDHTEGRIKAQSTMFNIV